MLVLAGALSSPACLDRTVRLIEADWVTDARLRQILGLVLAYADAVGEAPSPSTIADMCVRQGSTAERAEALHSVSTKLVAAAPPDHLHAWAIKTLVDAQAERALSEAMRVALESLARGRRREAGGAPHDVVRGELLAALSAIDTLSSPLGAPEAALQDERDDILTDYAQRRDNALAGRSQGIELGVSAVDQILGGCGPGELVIIAARPSEGKTTLCVQAAWAAALAGHNV